MRERGANKKEGGELVIVFSVLPGSFFCETDTHLSGTDTHASERRTHTPQWDAGGEDRGTVVSALIGWLKDFFCVRLFTVFCVLA